MEFDVLAATQELSQEVGTGLRRIYAALRDDGALPATHKAVSMAFAHAALDQRPLLRRELDRARDLGTPAAFVAGAALLLALTRGETAFREFALAAAERFDLPSAGSRDVAEPAPDDSLGYFRRHFGGVVPERQQLFADLAPTAFNGYRLMHEGAIARNRLPKRDAELLLCTGLAAGYEFGLLDVHVAGARNAGAVEAEIAEAVLCAVPAAGVTAWAGGAGAILRTRL